jgi:Fungal specific transcription factor domain
MATQYGPSISSRSLRHTVLAYSDRHLPIEEFGESVLYHKTEAFRAIIQKVANPRTIDEADVFAACLWTVLSARHSPSTDEWSRHAYGCLEMIKELSINSKAKPSSEVGNVFEPLAYQVAMIYAMFGNTPLEKYQTVTRRRTTFRQRVIYSQAQHPFLDDWSKRLPASLHTILVVSIDLIVLLLHCIDRVAQKEVGHNFQRDPYVSEILKHVDQELNDVEFCKAVERLGQTVQASRDESTRDMQLLLYEGESLARNFIRFVRTTLEAPSLLQGLEDASTMAGELIKSAGSLILRMALQPHVSGADAAAPERIFQDDALRSCLLVLLLALPKAEVVESKRA